MSAPALGEALQQVPSFRDFMEGVCRDTVGGRHVLLLTGGHASPALLRVGLEGALARIQGPMLRLVTLAEQFPEESPAAFLARVTGLPEEQFHPASRSAGPSSFRTIYDVVWLEGVEALPAPQAKAWLEFFKLSTRYATPASHVFVLPLSQRRPPLQEVSSDTQMALHAWWGRLSVLDMRLVCRLTVQEPRLTPESLWREAVLPFVAGSDITLAARLWEAILEPEAPVMEVLRGYGREQGLEATAVREAVRRLGRSKGERTAGSLPPPSWLPLCELTTTACALLEDAPAVRNRLWRGQAALLMPRLNRLRMEVCKELSTRHSRTWPRRYGASVMDEEQQRSVEEDPLSTEFKPLETILRRLGAGGQRYLPLVHSSRSASSRTCRISRTDWTWAERPQPPPPILPAVVLSQPPGSCAADHTPPAPRWDVLQTRRSVCMLAPALTKEVRNGRSGSTPGERQQQVLQAD
jgi:hypothetical protein